MSFKRTKHDWASLQTYMNAHDRVLKTYSKFMDRARQYDPDWVTPNYLRLECLGIMFTTYNGNKVRVDITKDVEVDDSIPRRPRARTEGYSYNANLPGIGNLIRYDSPDPPASVGASTPYHHLFHHKHDWASGTEQILRLGDDDWPHVSEFLDEVLGKF